MNAQLPEHLIRVAIKDMIIGETAYAVPWSIQVDQKGRCWIRGDFNFSHEPFGTNQMQIVKTRDGFQFRVSSGEQYEPGHISAEAKSQMGLLPVVDIR